MNGNGSNPLTGIVNSVMKWIQHPFNTQGSAFDWFMFVGLLIIIAGLWNIILLHLTEDL